MSGVAPRPSGAGRVRPGGEGWPGLRVEAASVGARGVRPRGRPFDRRCRPPSNVVDGSGAGPCTGCGSETGECSSMAIVVGVDRQRAQITAQGIELGRGEISRARVRPAARTGVRRFLARVAGEALEVALEARTGGRFWVGELRAGGAVVRLAEPAQTAARRGARSVPRPTAPTRHPREPRWAGRLPQSWIPARSHPRSARPGQAAPQAQGAALRMAAAGPGGALPPRRPAAAPADHERGSRRARGPGPA